MQAAGIAFALAVCWLLRLQVATAFVATPTVPAIVPCEAALHELVSKDRGIEFGEFGDRPLWLAKIPLIVVTRKMIDEVLISHFVLDDPRESKPSPVFYMVGRLSEYGRTVIRGFVDQNRGRSVAVVCGGRVVFVARVSSYFAERIPLGDAPDYDSAKRRGAAFSDRVSPSYQ